ncbi:hypothetical protein E0K93_11595 [Puniceibacterium sp. HSS470]|nr:hypothetical protein E0K93_11595 [Puniceibacterium sp. HSS470]
MTTMAKMTNDGGGVIACPCRTRPPTAPERRQRYGKCHGPTDAPRPPLLRGVCRRPFHIAAIRGSGLRAQGSGLRAQGSGLRAQGSGLRTQCGMQS